MKDWIVKRWAYIGLGSWCGKGSPSLRSLANLGGWIATLKLRQGSNFYGRQQCGILDVRPGFVKRVCSN